MRLLFISPVGAFFSGAEVAIGHLMVSLSERGHEIINVIPDNGEHRDLTYIKFMNDHHIDLYELKTQKWWWKEAYKINEADENAIFAYHHKNISDIQEIIKTEHIDAVISNTANLFQGAIAASLENVPHYYIIHEFPFGEFGYYKDKIALMQAISEKIFVVQGDLYSELKKYIHPEKLIEFIPYSHLVGVDLEDSTQERIVSIGGINERKNQLELIKAFEKLQPTDRKLVFIGGWDEFYKRVLDDYILSHNIDGVEFLGHRENPFQMVHRKDLLVLTSKMEAFPLVYVESILAGVPTLVSEALGHNTVRHFFGAKNSYPLGDEEQLAREIDLLFSRFADESEFAKHLQSVAKEKYSISQLYNVFYEEFENTARASSDIIKPLAGLIGWNLPEHSLKLLEGQLVTVYHSNEIPYYQVDTFELKSEDCITIPVGNADYIRVDLSNRPNMYDSLEMLDKSTGEILSPVHTTAVAIERKYMFLGNDCQIVYDTRDRKNHLVEFSYKHMLISNISEDYQNYNKQIKQLETELQTTKHQYDLVTHSRRWKISTAIINFFRRK